MCVTTVTASFPVPPQHHCRSCSLLLCGTCSSKAIALPLQHAAASGLQRVCDYCFTYESRRVAFESQHRPLLATGALFLKHPHGRGGAPKSRYVRVSDDRTRLVWRAAEQARAADMADDLETSLALKQITSVRAPIIMHTAGQMAPGCILLI